MKNTMKINNCTLVRQVKKITLVKSGGFQSVRCGGYMNCEHRLECLYACADEDWAGFTSDMKGYKPIPKEGTHGVPITGCGSDSYFYKPKGNRGHQ